MLSCSNPSQPPRATCVGAPRVAGRLAEMEEDVRARRSERDQRQAGGDRKPPPRPPGGNGQRYEQQDARILRARREADGEAGELDSARDHERERDGDSERQRDVRDGHP